jgi:hypothetical protein
MLNKADSTLVHAQTNPPFMSDLGFSESDFYLIFFAGWSIGLVLMGILFVVLEVQSQRRLREIQMRSLDQARTGLRPRIIARMVSPEEIEEVTDLIADPPSPDRQRRKSA